MWIRESEWQALLPKDPKVGQEIEIPENLVYRLSRFHLIDNTRGEPPMWARNEVRNAALKLVVSDITKDEVRLKLTGATLLATDADEKMQNGDTMLRCWGKSATNLPKERSLSLMLS